MKRRVVKNLVYDGRPVVLGAIPDPRAWLGREKERPRELVDIGHFEKFDRRRKGGLWSGGSWNDTTAEVKRTQKAAGPVVIGQGTQGFKNPQRVRR